jgi:hypothetical protein
MCAGKGRKDRVSSVRQTTARTVKVLGKRGRWRAAMTDLDIAEILIPHRSGKQEVFENSRKS